jgi:hypothetical protein
MRAAALLVAIAVATPAAAFFREGDFKVAHAAQDRDRPRVHVRDLAFLHRGASGRGVDRVHGPSLVHRQRRRWRCATSSRRRSAAMAGDPGDIARCILSPSPAAAAGSRRRAAAARWISSSTRRAERPRDPLAWWLRSSSLAAGSALRDLDGALRAHHALHRRARAWPPLRIRETPRFTLRGRARAKDRHRDPLGRSRRFKLGS